MGQGGQRAALASGGSRWPASRAVGAALVAMGMLLLVGVGLYYGYALYARSNLAKLNVSAEAPPATAQTSFNNLSGQATQPHALLLPASVEASPPTDAGAGPLAGPARAESPTFQAEAFAALYPGDQMHPKYWSQPLWAGTDTRQRAGLPEGYRPVFASELSAFQGARPSAQRIRIPSIDVDSVVSELQILDLGDSRAYETPKNVVGHIPETANPGEAGNAWFFGHLESPIRREGNVFRRLPEVPKHLKSYVETGEAPVYVFLQSQDGEYLYQVTATLVVHGGDLRLSGSSDASITLVTCVPRLSYDYRLVVTAMLVGVKG